MMKGGVVDHLFTLKQIGKKVQEKKYRMFASFKDLGKVYEQ